MKRLLFADDEHEHADIVRALQRQYTVDTVQGTTIKQLADAHQYDAAIIAPYELFGNRLLNSHLTTTGTLVRDFLHLRTQGACVLFAQSAITPQVLNTFHRSIYHFRKGLTHDDVIAKPYKIRKLTDILSQAPQSL